MGGDRYPDGVETYPATRKNLATYTQARAQLAAFRARVLVDGQRNRSYQPGQSRLCDACGGLAIQFDPSLHSIRYIAGGLGCSVRGRWPYTGGLRLLGFAALTPTYDTAVVSLM